MILLDTHIWVWWVDESYQLTAHYQSLIEEHKADGLGVSIISCWEVAKLVENGRLKLQCPVEEWIEQALAYPDVRLLQLTPRIVVESTQLPGSFHRDPADQIVVATARIWKCPLLTADDRILQYAHVSLLEG
jgi:PIN domain nuclease of toxin-antitoxin system